MNRRTLISLAAVAPLALAACGSDSDGASDAGDSLPAVTDPVDTTNDGTDVTPDPDEAPGEDAAPADGPLPADDAEVVMSLTIGGGFQMRELAFQNAPTLVVTGDGRVITLAAVPEIFPGPLVVPHIEQTITPEGVQVLLAAADDAGLLTELEFDENSNIADAPTTTLEIATADGTFVHAAYALGMAGGGPLAGDDADTGDANAALQSFVDSLSDLAGLVGAENLGSETDYEPTGHQIVVFPIDANASGGEVDPTIVDWPSDGVSLSDTASSGECTVVDDPAIGDLLASATILTYFEQDGETFQVLARPDYPGQSC